MRNVKAYLIQWEPAEPSKNGQAGTEFVKLPGEYLPEIGEFLQHVGADSAAGRLTNPYSVDTLYGEPGAGGEYNSSFGQAFIDSKPYPPVEPVSCPLQAELAHAKQPCISDTEASPQIAEEVGKFVEAQHLPTGLGAIYFLLTPNEVNSCAGTIEGVNACNTNFYCAYHSAFLSSGKIVIYANMPYDDWVGCELPDEVHGRPADDEIDTLGHEHNEAVTDPLGNAWFDVGGNEVADKCSYPFFDPSTDFNAAADAYGQLLGGEPAEFVEVEEKGERFLRRTRLGNAFNAEVDGGHYLLQREWNNAAGGCVARAPLPVVSFAVYPSPGVVNQPLAFNGSASMPLAGQLVGYRWNFGDGSPEDISGAQTSHSYSSPGAYTVTLTVTNDSGASASMAQSVSVSSPATPIVSPVTPIVLTRTVLATPVAFSAEQLAAKLGLPGNGAKLSGSGPFSLGHAECPPACGVTVRLFAKVTSGKGRRRSTKLVRIGSAHLGLGSKGAGALVLSLNAKGKALLRKKRSLSCRLVVAVEGQEGGTWQIVRSLTLKR